MKLTRIGGWASVVSGGAVMAVLCFTHCTWLCGGQDEARGAKPFAGLSELAEKQWGKWDGNQNDLSREFNTERARLGGRFEKELLVFLDEDSKKHRRIPRYIDAGEPRPYLGICILEQGLAICRGKMGLDAEAKLDAEAELVSLSINVSVRCEKAGLHVLAVSHKKEAEALLAAKPILQGARPAMDPGEQKVYEAIGVAVKKDRKTPRPPAEPPASPRGSCEIKFPISLSICVASLERLAFGLLHQKAVLGDQVPAVLCEAQNDRRVGPYLAANHMESCQRVNRNRTSDKHCMHTA